MQQYEPIKCFKKLFKVSYNKALIPESLKIKWFEAYYLYYITNLILLIVRDTIHKNKIQLEKGKNLNFYKLEKDRLELERSNMECLRDEALDDFRDHNEKIKKELNCG